MMASLTSIPPNMQKTKGSTPPKVHKKTTIDLVGGIRCNLCQMTFANKKDYDSHYVSHGNTTEIIYTCNICYKEIAGYPSFRGHCYTIHVIKERYRCEDCTKQFSKLSALKEHINTVHKFRCPQCTKKFTNKKEMQLHQIIHNSTDNPPYACNYCEDDIDTVDECKDHVEKHIEYLYSCPICNKWISNKEHAAEHFKQHFGDETEEDVALDKGTWKTSEETYLEQVGGIFCAFCSSVLKNRVEFDAHFSCEHGDEDIVYMCVVCGKAFEKYSVFYNHCYNHTSKSRYECDICQKSFPRMSLLTIHRVACQQAGATNAKPFACTVCERRFGTEGRWREHLREAHGQHSVPCTYRGCDQVFDTPKQLILHQQSHADKIRHFCCLCKYVLLNSKICAHHMEMHKAKTYFCPVCKRDYKEKYLIMNHLPQHFETVLHLCKVCGKVYNARSRLLEHMKSHLVVKSFSCTYCDKSFSKEIQLSQHLNTHTGTKPYQCQVCFKSFASTSNWYKHIRRMHHEESLHIKSPIIKSDDHKEGSEEGSVRGAAVEEDDDSALNNNTKHDMHEQIPIQNEEISTIENQMSNTDPIGDIANLSGDADCLSDINDADASIDFSNVKLETYIFSVLNDDQIEVDNIPSNKDEINLFNANCGGNTGVDEGQFIVNQVNSATQRNFFTDMNGEHMIEKFNGNGVENAPIGKDPFQANVENHEPVDILKYISEMPENNSLFLPVTPQDPLAPCAVEAPADAGFPCEYGPEFVDLDGLAMPHIDPLLTIRSESCDKMYVQMQNDNIVQHAAERDAYGVSVAAEYENVPKWEPIITKLYDECAYGYNDMSDTNRLSIMNTDIF